MGELCKACLYIPKEESLRYFTEQSGMHFRMTKCQLHSHGASPRSVTSLFRNRDTLQSVQKLQQSAISPKVSEANDKRNLFWITIVQALVVSKSKRSSSRFDDSRGEEIFERYESTTSWFKRVRKTSFWRTCQYKYISAFAAFSICTNKLEDRNVDRLFYEPYQKEYLSFTKFSSPDYHKSIWTSRLDWMR